MVSVEGNKTRFLSKPEVPPFIKLNIGVVSIESESFLQEANNTIKAAIAEKGFKKRIQKVLANLKD